jgi:hypothetical protein
VEICYFSIHAVTWTLADLARAYLSGQVGRTPTAHSTPPTLSNAV